MIKLPETMNRRKLLKSIGTSAAVAMAPGIAGCETPKSGNEEKNDSLLTEPQKAATFKYCLNTSTISGQKPGILGYIDIASKAGYDAIELWIRDIKTYLEEGNTLASLKKYIDERNLEVASAIGFAPWLAPDEEERKKGFAQMKEEMEMMAALGSSRIAAPAAGVKTSLDLFEAGQHYRDLLDLGRSTGVMPQLEVWGASKAIYHLGQALMIAAVANDPDVHILADVYHLFRGDSGFDALKMLEGHVIEMFHMNDYVAEIPREQQQDKDRVYPGDGVAPMKAILTDLKNMGGTKILSLELFNPDYWQQDALEVAKTGLRKMKEQVDAVS
jgi:sugar phosphate isomerase/epimerase